MADTDLIACLYPADGRGGSAAKQAIKLEKNERRYVPERFPEPEIRPGRRTRGTTEEPEQGGGDLDYCPRLELRFSDGPKTSYGFVFGCDKDCDIVLPNMRGISSHHFVLTFDDDNRPIVKDLGSLFGTQVTYNKQGKGWRRDFVWIVGGERVPEDETPIVIYVNKHLKFQLVVPHHDMSSQLYIDNVGWFRLGTADTEDLFGGLKFLPETERPTGTHTPGTGPIFLKKKLGEGSFGVVTHFWNVSTAEEYALKQPSDRAIWDREVDTDAWSREAGIMGRISHKHIVQFLGSDDEPLPRLYFEYVPGGSLNDQEHMSTEECKQVLRQLLSALAYLHGLEPPIVHRDIKPDNILVQYRYGDVIYVKFGDFGLSRERRESGDWKTVCGSRRYIAPEILEKKKYIHSGGRERRRYTAAVDIWSLGVVMFQLLCGLPRYDNQYQNEGTLWGEKILKKLREELKRRPNEVIQLLSATMLIMEPELRGSAQECYDRTLLLSGGTEDAYQTPIPPPYTEDQQATLRYEDPQTAIFQGAEILPRPDWSGDTTIDSAEMQRRFIRSDNPSPTSHRRKSGRISRSSKARHSKRSRHIDPAAESTSQEKEHEVELDTGNSWGVGGRSWREGGSYEDEEQDIQYAHNDEQEVAAALLLGMKNGDYDRAAELGADINTLALQKENQSDSELSGRERDTLEPDSRPRKRRRENDATPSSPKPDLIEESDAATEITWPLPSNWIRQIVDDDERPVGDFVVEPTCGAKAQDGPQHLEQYLDECHDSWIEIYGEPKQPGENLHVFKVKETAEDPDSGSVYDSYSHHYV